MARSAPSRRRTILDEGRARPFWNGQVVCACRANIEAIRLLWALRLRAEHFAEQITPNVGGNRLGGAKYPLRFDLESAG
jgi:hypothetical protein